jgi:hypothetical protein
MTVDERARHRLYLKLEEVLGPEEAGTLMGHLPPAGWGDVATKQDLYGGLSSLEERLTLRMEIVEQRLEAKIERSARGLVVWMSVMVLATGGLAFAAGRFV